MTAHGVGPATRPTENWQHHFCYWISYWISTGTEPKAVEALSQLVRAENPNVSGKRLGMSGPA